MTCDCCNCCCKKEKNKFKVFINDREVTFAEIHINRNYDHLFPKRKLDVEIYLDENNKLNFETYEYKFDHEKNEYYFYVLWL